MLFHVIDLGDDMVPANQPSTFFLAHDNPQASLFHVIDLGDDMAFEELAGTASADALSCNMDGVPTDESNLVIKVSGRPHQQSIEHQTYKR